MARYIGPVCRLCRREGMKLFLKGERCYTEKCAIEKRNYAAGTHGRGASRRWSATASSCARSRRSSAPTACWRISSAATSTQAERDPRHHRRDPAAAARTASRQRDLPPGLATSRAAGAAAGAPRPLPGQRPQGGHPVALGEGRATWCGLRQAAQERRRILHALEEVKGRGVPEWLDVRRRRVSAAGRTSVPTREQINLPVQEQLIVELYSK